MDANRRNARNKINSKKNVFIPPLTALSAESGEEEPGLCMLLFALIIHFNRQIKIESTGHPIIGRFCEYSSVTLLFFLK
jgi:hypothetical protein